MMRISRKYLHLLYRKIVLSKRSIVAKHPNGIIWNPGYPSRHLAGLSPPRLQSLFIRGRSLFSFDLGTGTRNSRRVESCPVAVTKDKACRPRFKTLAVPPANRSVDMSCGNTLSASIPSDSTCYCHLSAKISGCNHCTSRIPAQSKDL